MSRLHAFIAHRWTKRFLFVTWLAVGMELYAAFDGDPRTKPWTVLIVDHIPWEVSFALWATLSAWTFAHFYVRYRARGRK